MVDIPQAARRANQRVRIYQLTWSGTYQYDYYGFIQLTYGSTVVSGSGPGDQRKNLFGISGDAGVSFRPNWVGSGVLFNFSTTLFTKTFNYVGEESLFGISSTEEAVTWDYNLTSVDLFKYNDFGSVSGSPIDSITIQSIANETIQSRADDKIIDLVVPGSTSGTFLDFGTILTDGVQTPSTVTLDLGFIWQNQTNYPFGLFPITGSAKQVFTPNYQGSGTLFAFGKGRGRTKPRWIAFVQIGIFGAAKTNFSLLHKGSGNLFSLNNAEDRRAYAYDGSGALYAFSGAAESFGADTPEDTALLPLQGAAGVSFRPNWVGEGVIQTAGTAVERQTDHWQGSGTLFNFETADEKITYHYSSESNDIFQYRDYGSVAESPIESITIQSIASKTIESRKDDRIIDMVVSGSSTVAYLDYGPILLNGEDAPETVREDYGSIMESISRYTMGDFLFNGEADTTRVRNYQGSGNINLYIRGVIRVDPSGKRSSTLNLMDLVQIAPQKYSLVLEIYSTLYPLTRDAPTDTKLQVVYTLTALLLLRLKERHILHTFSSMLLATLALHLFPTGMDLAQQLYLVRQARVQQSILLLVEICSDSPMPKRSEHIITTQLLQISTNIEIMILLAQNQLILGSLLIMQTRSLKTIRMIRSSTLLNLV